MKLAALIGTNHANQYPGNIHGHADIFTSYILKVAKARVVDLIAEEMSREALTKARVEKSSVQLAAEELRLLHLFCDPDSEERTALKILDHEQLKQRRGLVHAFDDQIDLLEQDEKEYWPLREAEWLARLQQTNHSKLLFVLGANHVESFASLLSSNKYKVEILNSRWRPENNGVDINPGLERLTGFSHF